MSKKLSPPEARAWVKRKRARAWAAKISAAHNYVAALRNEYLDKSSNGVWDDVVDDQLQAAITSLASAEKTAEAVVKELEEERG